jgi:hypothetical protein
MRALGMGLIFTPALSIQSQWFFKRRGFIVSAVMSDQNVGGKYIFSQFIDSSTNLIFFN